MSAPFQPRGKMSLKDACAEIIGGLEPDDGIGYLEAVAEVENLTGLRDVTVPAVRGAMRAASEALLAAGTPGVRTSVRYGWVRMTDTTTLRHAVERQVRARRQVVRGGHAARAANPEALSWEDRQRRDEVVRTQEAIAGLLARRAAKKRPMGELDEAG